MNRYPYLFMVFILIIHGSMGWCDKTTPPGQGQIGCYIQDVESGRVIHQQNIKSYFTPASIIKMLTTTAALVHFDQNFRFVTRLFHEEEQQDLILELSGDPTFTTPDLESMLQQLKQKGINDVSGDFLIDDGIFDDTHYGPGWMTEDMGWYFNSPVSGTILDRNTFSVDLLWQHGTPSMTVQAPIGMKLQKKLRRGESTRVDVKFDDNNRYTLYGTVSDQPSQQRLAIVNPRLYMRDVIQATLKKLGIQLHGSIRFISKHRATQPIITHASDPLLKVIQEANFESNNLMTEAILKNLGCHYSSRPGTWKKGQDAIRAILTPYIKGRYVIADGSGLSRYSLITPEQMGQLLYHLYHSPYRDLLWQILPRIGQDGLTGRIFKSWTKEKERPWLQAIHLKTGSMTSVSCFAGLVTAHRRTYVVVMMANHFIGSPQPWRQWQLSWLEQFLENMVEQAT